MEALPSVEVCPELAVCCYLKIEQKPDSFVNALASCATHMWAGYSDGNILVYDLETFDLLVKPTKQVVGCI